MGEKEVYLVSDYNPKYLDGPIVSSIAGILSDIQDEEDVIESFKIDLVDEVKGLSQNSAKAILRAEIITDIDITPLIEKLNGMVRLRISDQSIYSVSISASTTTKYSSPKKR